ncbi:unnamed protein product, partial [Gulo gulo]
TRQPPPGTPTGQRREGVGRGLLWTRHIPHASLTEPPRYPSTGLLEGKRPEQNPETYRKRFPRCRVHTSCSVSAGLPLGGVAETIPACFLTYTTGICPLSRGSGAAPGFVIYLQVFAILVALIIQTSHC